MLPAEQETELAKVPDQALELLEGDKYLETKSGAESVMWSQIFGVLSIM